MPVRDGPPVDAPAVVVLIPVLDRPHRARPVAESIWATSWAAPYFIVTDGDKRELRAVKTLQRNASGPMGFSIVDQWTHGDYARKINHGVRAVSADWYFQGADDLVFHPGWLDAALRTADLNRARVIGTQDLCNPRTRAGRHSTHSLVARSYVDEVGTGDERGKMLHEGYAHGFVDDELVYVAMRRREFAFSRDAVVEHLHPTRKTAEMDSTYEKALDRKAHARDRALFRARRRRIDPSAARRRAIRGMR